MAVKVHKFEVVIVDTDNVGPAKLVADLETSDIVRVMDRETIEVDGSTPFNHNDYRRLFPKTKVTPEQMEDLKGLAADLEEAAKPFYTFNLNSLAIGSLSSKAEKVYNTSLHVARFMRWLAGEED